MKRRFGVGVERDGTSQCGCRSISGNKTDRQHLHLGIGQIQGCRDANAQPAPRRCRDLLPGPPAFAVEEIIQFIANVITYQLETGERCWYRSRAAGGRAGGRADGRTDERRKYGTVGRGCAGAWDVM